MSQADINRAVEFIRKAAQTALEPLDDVEYVEACGELASDFESRAEAKQEELDRDADEENE